EDGQVQLWELPSGQLRTTFRGHKGYLWSLAFAADGKTLLSGGQDQTVILWDVATGARRSTFRGQGVPILRVAISPDGKTVASGSSWNNRVKVWDVATHGERFTLPGISAAFSPDGNSLATAGWSSPKLWDLATGQERERPPALAK